MADDGAQFSTEAALRRQQGIACHVRTHRAIAQDKVGQDREHRVAPRALYPPDSHPAQADTDIMGVAGQTPALAAASLVEELKAESENKREHELDKRFGVA
jgi:hypothetical protein